MTIDVAPAMWRRENNNYLVKRVGYILFNFLEMTEDYRIDGATKKTFVMTAKNLDAILDLDPRAKYDAGEDSNEELLLYKSMNSPLTNILKICKNEDRTFSFSYCEAADDDNIQSFNEILLKPGQVRMVQSICEFALPALTGMHAIYNPSIIG